MLPAAAFFAFPTLENFPAHDALAAAAVFFVSTKMVEQPEQPEQPALSAQPAQQPEQSEQPSMAPKRFMDLSVDLKTLIISFVSAAVPFGPPRVM